VTASWGTAGYRRAVFQTLHAVERRQALTGSVVDDDGRARGLVHVPAPGGPGLDVRLQASIASIVAPLVRAHLEAAPGGNAVEAGVVVDVEPVQVSVTALRRGFVDVAGVFSADVARLSRTFHFDQTRPPEPRELSAPEPA
jgi:hypothetical protein